MVRTHNDSVSRPTYLFESPSALATHTEPGLESLSNRRQVKKSSRVTHSFIHASLPLSDSLIVTDIVRLRQSAGYQHKKTSLNTGNHVLFSFLIPPPPPPPPTPGNTFFSFSFFKTSLCRCFSNTSFPQHRTGSEYSSEAALRALEY